MDTMLSLVTAALAPLQTLSLKIMAVMPAVVAAFLLLFVGAFAAHWLRYLTEHVLDMLKIDDYARRVGFSNIIERVGLGSHVTRLIGVVVYATIVMAFILGAADVMRFSFVADYLDRLLSFGPSLIAAVVVLGAGLFLGDLIGRIVHAAAEANHVRGSDVLMRITHAIVVIFSGIIALESLGIDVRLIYENHLNVIVTALSIGCAIAIGVAFGLAGKETAGRLISDITPKSKPVNNTAREPKLRLVK